MPPRPASFSGQASRSSSFRWKRRRAANRGSDRRALPIVRSIPATSNRTPAHPWRSGTPGCRRALGRQCLRGVRAANPCVSFVDAAPNCVCDTDVGFGSIASFRPCVDHFRSTPISRRFLSPSACLKRASFGRWPRRSSAKAFLQVSQLIFRSFGLVSYVVLGEAPN